MVSTTRQICMKPAALSARTSSRRKPAHASSCTASARVRSCSGQGICSAAPKAASGCDMSAQHSRQSLSDDQCRGRGAAVYGPPCCMRCMHQNYAIQQKIQLFHAVWRYTCTSPCPHAPAQPYSSTALYNIQPYSAIQHTTYTPSLWEELLLIGSRPVLLQPLRLRSPVDSD